MSENQIISVSTRPDNILLVELSDGRKGIFDVRPYLFKSQYIELNDAQLFQQVKTDGNRIFWPRGHEFPLETVESELKGL